MRSCSLTRRRGWARSPRTRTFFPLCVGGLALDVYGRTRRTRAGNGCVRCALDYPVVRSFLDCHLSFRTLTHRARDCERLPECDAAQHASDNDCACKDFHFHAAIEFLKQPDCKLLLRRSLGTRPLDGTLITSDFGMRTASATIFMAGGSRPRLHALQAIPLLMQPARENPGCRGGRVGCNLL